MNFRGDGRSDNTLRALFCEFGTLQNCDGSAIWKSGQTSVLAAVHGPIAPRQSQNESSSGCIVSIVIKSGNGGTSDVEWESFLTQQINECIVRESYPRCVISIILQIINDDGSILAASLHAAASALLDANIEMKYLPTAIACFSRNKSTSTSTNNTIALDPNTNEEESAQSVILFVFLPSSGSLIGCYTTASLRHSSNQLISCCKIAALAVPAVQSFWRLAIEKVTLQSYHSQSIS
jgi:exosome complex component RRP46